MTTNATTPEPRTAAGRASNDELRRIASSLIDSSRFPSRRLGTDDLRLLGENLNALLDEAQARPAGTRSEGLRAALLSDLTALAHWSPEEWAERGRGGDPIARTINAARDIVEARLG